MFYWCLFTLSLSALPHPHLTLRFHLTTCCLPYHLSLSLQIALYLSFLWGPADGNMHDGRALNSFPHPVLPTPLQYQGPTLTPNRNHPFWQGHVSPGSYGNRWGKCFLCNILSFEWFLVEMFKWPFNFSTKRMHGCQETNNRCSPPLPWKCSQPKAL